MGSQLATIYVSKIPLLILVLVIAGEYSASYLKLILKITISCFLYLTFLILSLCCSNLYRFSGKYVCPPKGGKKNSSC